MDRMMDSSTESAEGGLKQLVLRWFTETQAPHILNNGNFPDWFQGFAARHEAEGLLRDRAVGCFLIRLSDKAIGYILSYRGLDRCRHFVISQDQDGQFVVSGDCRTHSSLTELIHHYRVNPIEPFGETLTHSCHQVNSDLYDVVNFNSSGRSGVSVQALKNLWDQKNVQNRHMVQNRQSEHQSEPVTAQPPALPPKSENRKLTGAVSVDTRSLSQGVPPVPNRGLPLGLSLSGSLPRSDSLRGNSDPPSPPEIPQRGSRSRSLPRLNIEEEEEEEEESSSAPSPSPLKKVTCHTYSLHDPGALSESRSEQQDDDVSKTNPLYQDADDLSPQGGGLHPALPENTYELIPAEAAAAAAGQSDMYESLEDMKTNKSKSTWGKSNLKWKKFLPDYMKK